ncbi:hypothetical protein AWC38_SpisGene8197 [Stylophora pistillata]|uniref:Uncharacterized protein n=1 Tax=Stylophora pistillata TaxID=50429 RepID=A0A2B4S8Y3_STYPI|nr:hypothetical protein AWC38_SpisGene8197 [Stylophora pistillata]
MDAVVEATKKENLREQRAKEELAEVNKREESALNKKRKILDEIKEVEKEIEKVESKESYCKERLHFALQRHDENSNMKCFLENNKVDVDSMEHTVKQHREKTKTVVDSIANMQRVIESKEKLILAAEKREMVARDTMARIQEKLRAVERAGSSIKMNYTPLSEKQYVEKVELVKENITRAIMKRKKFEKEADAMEKDIVEREKKIAMFKKRNAELKQTTNELKGCYASILSDTECTHWQDDITACRPCYQPTSSFLLPRKKIDRTNGPLDCGLFLNPCWTGFLDHQHLGRRMAAFLDNKNSSVPVPRATADMARVRKKRNDDKIQDLRKALKINEDDVKELDQLAMVHSALHEAETVEENNGSVIRDRQNSIPRYLDTSIPRYLDTSIPRRIGTGRVKPLSRSFSESRIDQWRSRRQSSAFVGASRINSSIPSGQRSLGQREITSSGVNRARQVDVAEVID